jgi:hypothetical protein
MITLKITKENYIELEEAQNLVAQILQTDFDFICKEINELNRKNVNWTNVDRQDWNDSTEVRDAMKTLMRYYMTHDDYNEFMELQRVYGNV